MNTSIKKVNLAYPLIVSDFDGTLVASNGDIPQENKEIIAKYCQDGGKFVISTGRMHYGILPRLKELGLKGLVSCAHGSLIFDTETRETLIEGTIPTSVVVEMCKKMEE